jgi:hypothetical protein
VQCVLSIDYVSYGCLDYVDKELCYHTQGDWCPTLSEGSAKFAKRQLIITFPNNAGNVRVEIPYRIVEAVVVSSAEITLTLWEPPKSFITPRSVFLQDSTLVAKRLTGLLASHNSYKDAAISLVYRIASSRKDFEPTIRKLLKRDILPIFRDTIPSSPADKKLDLKQGWAELRDYIRKVAVEFKSLLPFGILYQSEALVRNGFLLPRTVRILLMKIAQGYRDETGEQASQRGITAS